MTTRREVFMVEAPEKHVEFRKTRALAAKTMTPISAYQAQLFYAIALYSAGESLENVRLEVKEAVSILALDPTPSPFDLKDPEQYFAALWGLSLSMLFGDASPVFEQRLAGQDLLIDRLLQLTGSKIDLAPTLLHPKPFLSLVNAMETSIGASQHIDAYLKTWYQGMGRTSWHDTHLRHDPTFFGYWAFELAAVVKALSLSDAGFGDNIFYPRDLVHQRLFRTWLDSDEGEDDRKAKAAALAQDDLKIAKNALSGFFSGEFIDEEGGKSLANGMKMLATVLGLTPEELKKNPQLMRVGLLQIFQAALNLSKATLSETENPTTVANDPLLETFKEIAELSKAEDQDIESASKVLAESEGFDSEGLDAQARLTAARARLETIHSTLEKLLKEEKSGNPGVFGGLERLGTEFASTLGIHPPKPRDIKAEVSAQVGEALDEANRKNMIGSDFDWSSIWKKS
jgi:hypothetical protein